MKLSSERILTTHVGSLPRPEALREMLMARESGETPDTQALDEAAREAVLAIVERQVRLGIDVVSDGEMSKISYATYVKDRYDGFGGKGKYRAAKDLLDYLDYARYLVKIGGTVPSVSGPVCQRPITLRDHGPLATDLANFRAAITAHPTAEAFMSAASPGVVSIFLGNEHYPSHQAYLEALAGVLKDEYQAIVDAGFLLQIDAPDLAMGRHLVHGDASLEAFRKAAALHVEVLNQATAEIPPERMRLHLCWGNYEGPHHHDVALADIIDIVLAARPMAISVEASNPRHEHEWEVFAETPLPDDKVLLPGVVDSTSNFIEHPRLVAQRLRNYADVVGRERVIASTDCGFATFAGYPNVFPDIAWAKLESLVEGARIASKALW
ncbi:MAG: cobalamin-independent methionine synthase II family protein [Alphaproteobacteria bacterium]|jgi:5-methyltetrahydropteroyltriglutamate--homocysteine methyltransferase|nr:cobalamin-independent methionine synthase II family protein [Alphaproteobacteria bacterium]